jgi:hypothetical protein
MLSLLLQAISHIIYLKQSLEVVPTVVGALSAMNNDCGPANALLCTIHSNLKREEIAG